MNHKKGRSRIAFVASITFCLAAADSRATTHFWIGTSANNAVDWDTTTNWSPNGIPSGAQHLLMIGARSGHVTLANTANSSTGSASIIRLNGDRTVGRIYAAQQNDRNISFHPGSGGSLTFDNGASDAIYMIRRDPLSNNASDVAQLRGGIDVNLLLNSNLVFDAFVKRGYGTLSIAGVSGVPSTTISNFINSDISGSGMLTMRVALLTSSGNATTNAFYSIEGGAGPNTHSGGTLFEKLTPTLGNGTSIINDIQSVYRLNKQHATGNGNTTVGAGATVLINNVGLSGGAISDLTTVSLEMLGEARGLLAIAAGHNETVAGLILDGVPQAPGTYGATGSGAAFVMDDWFVTSIFNGGSGYTGVLTVIPEPGTTLLGLVGFALALRRRRVG